MNNRNEILKTYKLYVNGQFPRTESGRYYTPHNRDGIALANVCLGSRKDFRDAVVAARKALPGWSGRTAYNRGQILYRIAEMLEARKGQFIEELQLQDSTAEAARSEVETCIDRIVYFAGWCDKYSAVFSTVNPVASSHFNFSVPEPTGVVAAIAPQDSSLLGLVSLIAPVIAGGNTVIILGSKTKPLCCISFGEIVHTADLPAGVVNILTGDPAELIPVFGEHMDVNAVAYGEKDPEQVRQLQESAALNVKRMKAYTDRDWWQESANDPYLIMDFQEIKTTWHPVESSLESGGKY
ncbi:MAG: hypothetical protein RL732_1269 [Bacteroidota bacterium]|jgi:acyl-CoA reductase-like NAD-dependent aldehyde dehydrogenase